MADANQGAAGAGQLSAQEQEFLKKYGKLPPKKDIAKKRMNKTAERKYFDSGDYVLSQTGKSTDKVPTAVPTPETIPHPTEKVIPKRPSHLTE